MNQTEQQTAQSEMLGDIAFSDLRECVRILRTIGMPQELAKQMLLMALENGYREEIQPRKSPMAGFPRPDQTQGSRPSQSPTPEQRQPDQATCK